MSKKAFDAIDTDGDGYITADELKASLGDEPDVSDDNIAAIIRMADDNGDQKITFEEYSSIAK